MGTESVGVPTIASEFAALRVDPRLQRRVAFVAHRLSAHPNLGFPQAMGKEAATEALYRLLANPRICHARLVEAHAMRTVERMPEGGVVRCVHDTTELTFPGESEREGLGRTRTTSSTPGFFAHVALALSTELHPKPLGVLGTRCWARTATPRSSRKIDGKTLSKMPNRESARWRALVDETEERVGSRCEVIHIMDREGDSYSLLSSLVEAGRRFVIRLAHDRRVHADTEDEETIFLSEAAASFEAVATREVPLSRRDAKPTPRSNKANPERHGRSAKLNLRAGRVILARPRYLTDELEQLELNIVHVEEAGAPDGAEPVGWMLVTTEAIDTAAQVEAVVDHYRARWTIEELFKALKTGCAMEKRQLESFQTLTTALAFFLPIAWKMLQLRSISRTAPDTPADEVLTASEIAILQLEQPQKMPKQGATIRDALYAIAGLGGHLKNNGPPGWRTLNDGMKLLLLMANAWDAAINSRGLSQKM